jgi:translation initiation factor IF-1
MLFGETVAVYCENHTEHINTLCGHFSSYITVNTLRLRYCHNRLMLFGETVAVYCENHTEHTNTLCGQNTVEFHWFTASGTYSNYLARLSQLDHLQMLQLPSSDLM